MAIKFHKPTKIVLAILIVLILGFIILIAVNYSKLKNQQPSSFSAKPSGTCSPNLQACNDNDKLCLDMNKNQACD